MWTQKYTHWVSELKFLKLKYHDFLAALYDFVFCTLLLLVKSYLLPHMHFLLLAISGNGGRNLYNVQD